MHANEVAKIAVRYCTDVAADTVADKSFAQTALLEWYRAKRRLLPWRGDNTSIPRSAYGTWISEVMLQQTRVETVIEYWNRWMAVFPDVKTLAIATPDEVNKLWAGLGYYRRAQMLLKGAIKVVEDYDGVLPNTTEELLKIPGIGPYTAGAIASIAYDKPTPLVDGNVMRVFSRLLALKLEVGGGAMEKQCWKIATSLVPDDAPGDFNQALMELGATVCKPTSPDCGSCPLRTVCAARNLVDFALAYDNTHKIKTDSTGTPKPGILDLFVKKRSTSVNCETNIEDLAGSAVTSTDTRTTETCTVDMTGYRWEAAADYNIADLPRDVTTFPRKVVKKKAKELSFSVCVFRTLCAPTDNINEDKVDALTGGVDRKPQFRYLFVRRPATGLLANQWEFPNLAVTTGIGTDDAAGDDVEHQNENENESPEARSSEGAVGGSNSDFWAPFPAYLSESLHLRWCKEGHPAAVVGTFEGGIEEDEKHPVLCETRVTSDFEPIVHIFSHQRHTMHVSLHDVCVTAAPAVKLATPPAAMQGGESEGGSEGGTATLSPVTSQWMTAEEITAAGITTGCKKILALVLKAATAATGSVVKTGKVVKGAAVAADSAKRPIKKRANATTAAVGDETTILTDTCVKEEKEGTEGRSKQPVNPFEMMKLASSKAASAPPPKKRAKKQ